MNKDEFESDEEWKNFIKLLEEYEAFIQKKKEGIETKFDEKIEFDDDFNLDDDKKTEFDDEEDEFDFDDEEAEDDFVDEPLMDEDEPELFSKSKFSQWNKPGNVGFKAENVVSSEPFPSKDKYFETDDFVDEDNFDDFEEEDFYPENQFNNVKENKKPFASFKNVGSS
jgi:hypothetical protein